jgi:thioredoxin-like negative regulator of GroEL
VLEKLSRAHAGRLKIVKVNVDDQPELARRWDAMSIPLLVALRDGEEIDRIVGAPPPTELERRLEPLTGAASHAGEDQRPQWFEQGNRGNTPHKRARWEASKDG